MMKMRKSFCCSLRCFKALWIPLKVNSFYSSLSSLPFASLFHFVCHLPEENFLFFFFSLNVQSWITEWWNVRLKKTKKRFIWAQKKTERKTLWFKRKQVALKHQWRGESRGWKSYEKSTCDTNDKSQKQLKIKRIEKGQKCHVSLLRCSQLFKLIFIQIRKVFS